MVRNQSDEIDCSSSSILKKTIDNLLRDMVFFSASCVRLFTSNGRNFHLARNISHPVPGTPALDIGGAGPPRPIDDISGR